MLSDDNTYKSFHELIVGFLKKFIFDHNDQVNCNIFSEIVNKSEMQLKDPNYDNNTSNKDIRLITLNDSIESFMKTKELNDSFYRKNNYDEMYIRKVSISETRPVSCLNTTKKFNEFKHNVVDIELNDFHMKLKIFNIMKTNVKKQKEKRAYKRRVKEQEKMAHFFYINLTKSRCFYVLQKLCRSKGIYSIIHEKYSEMSYLNKKKLLFKFLMNCFHKKKLLLAYDKLRNKRLRIKVFNGFCKKISYFLQQKQLYFIQLTNNQFSIKFLLHILTSVNKLEAKNQLKIRTKNRISHKLNQIYIRSSYYNKLDLFKVLKNNLIAEKYKEYYID